MAWKITLVGCDELQLQTVYDTYGAENFDGINRYFRYKGDADNFQSSLRAKCGIVAERSIIPDSVVPHHKEMKMPKRRVWTVELIGDEENQNLTSLKGGEYKYKRDAVTIFNRLSGLGVFCRVLDNGKEILSFTAEHKLDDENKARAVEAKTQLRLALSKELEEYMNEAEHQDGYGYWTEYFLMEEGTWDIQAMLMDFNLSLQSKLEDLGFEQISKNNNPVDDFQSLPKRTD